MKKLIQKFFQNYIEITTILIFSTFGMLGKLGVVELQPMGSATHAAIAREILRSGNWLNLQWPFVGNFYQFPPLFFWLQAITFKIFGISDITAKFTSSFFGILTILATFYLGKLLLDNYSAFLSSMVIILTPYFFRHSRKCELETILIFFITLGIIFFVLSEKKNNEKFLLLSGLACGLGFFAKGPPAFAVWGSIATYYLFTKQYKKFLSVYFWCGVLISILVPSIWFVLQFIYGGEAFRGFFVNQVLLKIKGGDRPATNFVEKFLNYTFFFRAFFSYYLPWSIVGLWGVRKIVKERIQSMYILLLWVIVVWIGFTIPMYKDDYYLLAMYPGWAVICGIILAKWTSNISQKIIFYSFILSIVFAVVTLFTPIKFDKTRNPEFKLLASEVKTIVPVNEKIITYDFYPYDMMSLIPWYMDRAAYPIVNNESDFISLLSSSETKFFIVQKEHFDYFSQKISLYPLYYCGRVVFGSNKKLFEPKIK